MDVHPQPVAPSFADTAVDKGCEAVFRLLADGRRHGFSEVPHRAPQAVRADLATLRSLGMAMEHDDVGVRAAPFVALDAAAIARDLDQRGRRPWRVQVAFRLGSTNTELLRDAKRQDGGGAPRLLAAEFQQAGRGRLGRGWSSAAGASITVSFALRIARSLAQLDGVTLVCGLAVQRIVSTFGVPARLKWPNDVLVDGRKLAGILVEVHATSSGTVLVIGVGINVASAARPADRAGALAVASLRQDGSRPVDRNRLVADLAIALDAHLATFESDGFGAFFEAWNRADAFAGQPVRLESPPAAPITGIARGVDASGALLLDVGGERRRIIAGDVSLRAANVEAASA